jgi:uncharacterized protein
MKKILSVLLLGLASSVFAQAALPSCEVLKEMTPAKEGRLFTDADWVQVQNQIRESPEIGAVGVAVLYVCGIGVQKDVGRGVRELERAADDLNPSAFAALYYLYSGFLGVPKNPVLAQKWLQLGAEQGVPELQMELGRVYWQGFLIRQDVVAAERWMLKAAGQGHLDTYANLVQFYLSREKYADALKWSEIGAAAGDAMSAYLSGYIYSKGLGTHSNVNLALQRLTYAAEKRFPFAELRLGKMYSTGTFAELDYEKALGWYRRAAARSVPDAQAALANAYERGLGVPVDLREAYLWRKKVVVQRTSFSQEVRIAPRQWHLRDLFDCGGIGDAVTDLSIANDLSWARQGSPEAQVKMAKHLASKNDVEQTLCWYLSAVDGGDLQSTSNLGLAYLKGDGLPINLSLGVHFLRIAAEGNNVSAKTRLANAYLSGIGVERNPVAAYAVNFSGEWSGDELDALLENYHPAIEDEMSPAQIAQARRLIRDMSVPGEYLISLDRATTQ